MTKQDFLLFMEKEFREMLEIVKAKNADYCGDEDPFANFKLVESMNVCSAEKAILVRMSDKFSRITNLLGKGTLNGQVNDESVTDTLRDLANYAIILKLLILDNRLEHGNASGPIGGETGLTERYGNLPQIYWASTETDSTRTTGSGN